MLPPGCAVFAQARVLRAFIVFGSLCALCSLRTVLRYTGSYSGSAHSQRELHRALLHAHLFFCHYHLYSLPIVLTAAAPQAAPAKRWTQHLLAAARDARSTRGCAISCLPPRRHGASCCCRVWCVLTDILDAEPASFVGAARAAASSNVAGDGLPYRVRRGITTATTALGAWTGARAERTGRFCPSFTRHRAGGRADGFGMPPQKLLYHRLRIFPPDIMPLLACCSPFIWFVREPGLRNICTGRRVSFAPRDVWTCGGFSRNFLAAATLLLPHSRVSCAGIRMQTTVKRSAFAVRAGRTFRVVSVANLRACAL
jgi:hypothetical protein